MTHPSLRSLDLDTEYRTGQSRMREEFFAPCLSCSAQYDRAIGYFRSSVFLVLGAEVHDFARRGGTIRFICSPELTTEDLAALEEGYQVRSRILEATLVREIAALLSSAESKAPAELLATLVAFGVLDLRIALRPPSQGIYHEKMGIFRDSHGDAVSFKGSSNETWSGWHDDGNLESVEVFCSWANTTDTARVSRHREYFERLWSDEVKGVSVMPFPEAAKQQLCSVARDSVDEAIANVEIARGVVGSARRHPLPHQLEAIANWIAAGKRGVFQHATGSGKTYTAILVLKQHLSEGRPAIVVVPSQLLHRQWEKELRDELPQVSLLLAGAQRDSWRQAGRLETHTSDASGLGDRVTLVTMQTAATDEFRRRARAGSHLLLIADEVHQIGSSENAKTMSINAGARLGLSATPERFGDVDGTRAIFTYFGEVVRPIVSLADAIRSGRLVEYRYHPRFVRLSAPETEEWKAFTERIRLEVARSPRDTDGRSALSEHAKLLLIRRARIAKKAAGKVSMAIETLKAHYTDGERWLVYCDDLEQLRQVEAALRTAGMASSHYYSGMSGDTERTLHWLKRYGSLLLSVRCLDEGVDIPEVTHALILASSQNPRQFIQRRGRVLRRAPGKGFATIFDALVLPPSILNEPEQAALARSELRRAMEFSADALNRDAAAALWAAAAEIGLDDRSLQRTGVEEDQPAEGKSDLD